MMSDDWRQKIVKRIKRNQAAEKASGLLLDFNAKQQEVISAASPRLWLDIRLKFREAISAINKELGLRYFYSSDRDDPPDVKTLNLYIESPKGEIEVLFVANDYDP